MGCCSSSSQQVVEHQNYNAKEEKYREQFYSFYNYDTNKRAFMKGKDIYVEQKMIGSGFYSEVYLFKNQTDDSLHALKILKETNSQDALVNECVIMKDVDSQFVIKIEDLIQIDDKQCIMMEYANQGTLENFISQVLKKKIKINASQILVLACDLLQGLQAIHSKNIIHRDLKLDNLLVSDYRIKIADLGLATYLISKLHAQSIVGNIIYSAPEKFNQNYNYSSDIFSAGLIILQMIFGVQTSDIFRIKIRNSNYSIYYQNSPSKLKQFLESLLDQNPLQRKDAKQALTLCQNLKKDKQILDFIEKRIKQNLEEIKINQISILFSKQQKLLPNKYQKLEQMNENELFQKGLELFWNHDIISAENCFKQILKRNQTSVQAQCGIILCGIYYEDWINMKQYTQEWIDNQLIFIHEQNPNDYIYYFCLALINCDLESINKCIELNSQFAEGIAFKGFLLIKNNELEEAEILGNLALETSEESPFVLQMLGYIFEVTDSVKSKEYLQTCIQINPQNYSVLYKLGLIEMNNNQLDNALDYFDQSLQACPYYKNSILKIIEILSSTNKQQYQDVIFFIENLFEQVGGEFDFLLFDLANSYQLIGEDQKAIDNYEKILLLREDCLALYNIGTIYKNKQEYDKAIAYFQRAIIKQYKLSYLSMYDLYRHCLDSEYEAKQYLIDLLKLQFNDRDEKDCVLKIQANRLLNKYKEALNCSEQLLKLHPHSKMVNTEIQNLISQEDYEEDLEQQQVLSEQIQKCLGATYELTVFKFKYFSLNGIEQPIQNIVIPYFEDFINKQYNLNIWCRFPFEKYINQEQFEKIFLEMKKMCENNPNEINCQIYFLNLIYTKKYKLNEQMIEDFQQFFNECNNNLLNNYPDQFLTKFYRREYPLQLQNIKLLKLSMKKSSK